jgi:hypothetical protein
VVVRGCFEEGHAGAREEAVEPLGKRSRVGGAGQVEEAAGREVAG